MVDFGPMNWTRLLAYITGSVDQELLLRNEYLATENRILRNQVKGRLWLTQLSQLAVKSGNFWGGRGEFLRKLSDWAPRFGLVQT